LGSFDQQVGRLDLSKVVDVIKISAAQDPLPLKQLELKQMCSKKRNFFSPALSFKQYPYYPEQYA
jgi:hypothetical protein